MNINVRPSKSKPFQRRKPPMLPAATSSPETFIRFVVAKYQALLERGDALVIANARWPADSRLRMVLRAASEPPYDPANTPALAAVMTSDFVAALQPYSAAAQLFNAGLLLHFDRYAKIVVPDFVGLDELPPPFVAPGEPAPVGELTSQGTVIEPRKLEFIVVLTREMVLGSNAEKLVGDALKRAVAFGLDKALFDDQPGDERRPPGLRSFGNRIAESTAMNNETAMMMDVGALVGAAEHIAAGSGFTFVGRSRRIAAMRMMMKAEPPNFTLLPSAAGLALPESALLCIVAGGLAAAVGLPEVEIVEAATLEMDDAPGDLARAPRVRSLFQTDTLGMKLRLPASWTLRTPEAANWITCLWPSDIGGGGEGLPEAPFDEFSYGRKQGAWSSVVEEAPADPPSQGWVRGSPNTPGWHLLGDLTAHLAPKHNPDFTGVPTAETPVLSDETRRLATTAYVAAKVAGGSGGGIGEVPGALDDYVRTRFPGNMADWSPISATYAKLMSPAFGGTPTAPNPSTADISNRIATTQYVRDLGVISEAPDDVNHYGRSNRVWRPLDPVFAKIGSPAFTGTPTAPTPPTSDSSTRLATTAWALSRMGGIMGGPLMLAGAPTVDLDAVTKLYVDQRIRAPAVIAHPPTNIDVPASGAWVTLLGNTGFDLPRAGASLLKITISGTAANIGPGFALVGVRTGGANPIQKNAWLYGLTQPGATVGFVVELFAVVVGPSTILALQAASIQHSSSAPPNDRNTFTIVGGAASTIAERTQIVIEDLGPN